MPDIIKILSFIFQFTFVMLISVVGCFFLGYWLDNLFGTSFLTIVFFVMGALGGMTGVYRLAKDMFKDKEQ